MQSLTFIEIDIDRCSRSYGVAPCTASIPTTGDRKCFNSLGTCQDRSNFNDAGVTIRFAINTSFLPPDIDCIPCLKSVDYSPSILSLGVDLGQRASIKMVFEDHQDADTGPHGDPYLADRDYNPFTQGTFFGKFRARHPYLRGRALRLIRGEVGQALADMETRHFVIDSFDGPLPDGSFSITAKDVLKLADGDRAQAPRVSNGFLSADINASTTSATLAPAGIGNAEYPSSGYVAIGGTEICAFTRSADALTLTRGQWGTVGAAHTAQDRVQLCLHYAAKKPSYIIADLFENYADVPPSQIDEVAWEAEVDANLNRLYTALIAEPTPVKKLSDEVIEQAALAIGPNETAGTISFQVLKGISTDAVRIVEGNTLEGTIQIKEQPEKRVSQVWTYFGQINPLKSVDDLDNYRSVEVTKVDAQTELDNGSPAIKIIKSRWIPSGGRSVATTLNNKILSRYRRAPRRVTLSQFRGSASAIAMGQGARAEAWFVQDDTGAAGELTLQATRVKPESDRYDIEFEEMLYDVTSDVDDRPLTIDFSQLNYNMRAHFDSIYSPPVTGDIVNCTIQAGVIVGSSSAATDAFDVGSWPTEAATGNRTSGSPIIPGLSVDPIAAGWTAGMVVTGTGIPNGTKILTVDSTSQITLDKNATSGASTSTALTIHTVIINLAVEGRIQGCGGRGGSGKTTGTGRHGLPGGDALYTRYPINLSGAGKVYGGGGGGGAGGRGFTFSGATDGGRGGGGSGTNPGGAGDGNGSANPGTADAGGPGRGGGSGGAGNGGNGGGYGANGADGTGGSFGPKGDGGAAGNAIDGDSYVIESGSLTVAGGRVN